VWWAVVTGQMTFAEAIEKWPPAEDGDDDEEEAS
jgi:hypothetical protein